MRYFFCDVPPSHAQICAFTYRKSRTQIPERGRAGEMLLGSETPVWVLALHRTASAERLKLHVRP
jgi:hypothetical protein